MSFKFIYLLTNILQFYLIYFGHFCFEVQQGATVEKFVVCIPSLVTILRALEQGWGWLTSLKWRKIMASLRHYTTMNAQYKMVCSSACCTDLPPTKNCTFFPPPTKNRTFFPPPTKNRTFSPGQQKTGQLDYNSNGNAFLCPSTVLFSVAHSCWNIS